MYRREFSDLSGNPILPPGYSGTSMQNSYNAEQGQRRAKPSFEEGGDYSPFVLPFPDKKESGNIKKTGGDFLPPANSGIMSHTDDILLAGLLMLLITEGNCDDFTLFLLSFLLLC